MPDIAENRRKQKIATIVRGFRKNAFNPRFWRFVASGAAMSVTQWETEAWSKLLSTSTKVKSVPLRNIVESYWKQSIVLPVTRGEWDTPYLDLVVLGCLVKRFAPKRIFEIGTFKGAGTMTLIGNAPLDCKVWTTDITAYSEDGVESDGKGRLFEGTEYNDRIVQFIEDVNQLDLTPFADNIDLVFVDAGHDYEPVTTDIKTAFKLVAPGGLIVWHDYPYYAGVRQALDELAESKSIVHVEGTNVAFYKDSRA